LHNFIDEWKFYNFDPDAIKRKNEFLSVLSKLLGDQDPVLNLDSTGLTIQAVLLNQLITISYTGARLVEAFTYDGGDNVYISVISDF
jgi:hypothetical protein